MSRGARGLASLALLAPAIGCAGSKPDVAGAAESGADCEPGRCMADISARINDHRPAARECYLAGHQRDPALQGALVINFEIDPAGKVVDASQSSRDEQIMDAEVVECVASVIREISFAKSQRGKSTRGFHRYEFSPP